MKCICNTNLFCFCVIFAVSMLSSCRMNYGDEIKNKDLSIDTIPQIKGNWCWAACSQMVMTYLNPSDSLQYAQCKQAWMSMPPENARLCTVQTCCTGSGPSNDPIADSLCNHTCWPIFEQFGFRSMDTYTTWNYLSWEDMVNQLDNSKPLCLTYNWTGGGAHMIVMDGYKIDVDHQLYVHLIDPYSGYARNKNFPYEYPTVRLIAQDENRRSPKHILGRCYYNIEKIVNQQN